MKAYSKKQTAYESARRHCRQYGGTVAVIETLDLPGRFQVGTMSEVKTSPTGEVQTCKLFYGLRGKSAGPKPIIELDTALGCDSGA